LIERSNNRLHLQEHDCQSKYMYNSMIGSKDYKIIKQPICTEHSKVVNIKLGKLEIQYKCSDDLFT